VAYSPNQSAVTNPSQGYPRQKSAAIGTWWTKIAGEPMGPVGVKG